MKLDTTNILIGAGLFFVGYNLLNQLGAKLIPGSPQIVGHQFNLDRVTLTCQIPIENRTLLPIPFEGFQGFITYGAYQIAPLLISGPVNLVPNQITLVNFTINIYYAHLVGEIANIINDGSFLNALYLRGDLFAGGLLLPVNQKMRLV